MNAVAVQQKPQVKITTGHGAVPRGLPWRKTTRRVFLALVLALILFNVGLAGAGAVGYRYWSVQGESMEPAISSGSLVVARPTAPEDIRAGDIIGIPVTSEGAPIIAHRVVALLDDGNQIVALTMGDNNPVPDPDPLVLDKPVRRAVLIVPYLGLWLNPQVQWLLVGMCAALLGLIAVLRWSERRKTRNCTNDTSPV